MHIPSNWKAAGILCHDGNGRIVVGHKDKGRKGWMDFGGKKKRGETPQACAAREFREETGQDAASAVRAMIVCALAAVRCSVCGAS